MPAVKPPRVARLLVSVRNAEEAAIALEAGAALLDVKEPSKGSLGMAHHEAVAAVLEVAAGRVPVSAALGEWSPNILTDACWHLELPLTYIKWGLAGYANQPGWGEDLLETRRQVPVNREIVTVAYADWETANSLPPLELARFAKRFRYRAFLLDTYRKDGSCLLDYLKPVEIKEIVESLQRSSITVALGGSLKPEHLKQLKGITPDYYAVRGSVCAGGKRGETLDPTRIQKWQDLLSSSLVTC